MPYNSGVFRGIWVRKKSGAQWRLDSVAAAFAAAALDSSKWVDALDALAAETESIGTALLPLQVNSYLTTLPFSPAIESIVVPYFEEGWMERDLRRRAVPLLMQNRIFSEADYTTRDEIRREPFFQEYLVPRGFTWSAVLLMSAGDDAFAVSIQRHSDQDPFSTAELEKLRGLSDRLSAAAATAQALGYARLEAAMGAFESAGKAVILVDRFAKVVRINPAAEPLLGTDLEIVDRRLRSRSREATKLLYLSFKEVLSGQTSLAGPVTLPRKGRTPLLAYLTRDARISSDAFCPCQAVVSLVDPDLRPRLHFEALRACYGLTEAEAKLAAYLAIGETLDAAADQFEIAKATARNQLASIMAKVGVHRQAELVAALATLTSARVSLPWKP